MILKSESTPPSKRSTKNIDVLSSFTPLTRVVDVAKSDERSVSELGLYTFCRCTLLLFFDCGTYSTLITVLWYEKLMKTCEHPPL